MLNFSGNHALSVILPPEKVGKVLKLSGKQRLIFELLNRYRGTDVTGYELVQMAPEELSPATVYVHLDRMEEKGLITSKRILEEGTRRLPKRFVRLKEGIAIVHQTNPEMRNHDYDRKGAEPVPA